MAASPATSLSRAARPSGPSCGWPWCARRATTDGPHLVFFLHDEILVHTPARLAKQVAQIVRESAATAAKLLYGDTGVEFPVSAHINTVYLEPEDTLET